MAEERGPEAAEVPFELDRSMFAKTLTLQALRIPKSRCQAYLKMLDKFTLNWPRLRHVVPDPTGPDTRLLLLSDEVSGPDLTGLPDGLREQLIATSEVQLTSHQITLDYTYWPAEHILKEILPEGVEVPTSFETIGHVAHLNLRDNLLPYKKTIGEVLLEKNAPRIKTVLNKVGTIENQYRVPTFEVLAGTGGTETEVRQHGAMFRLNFAEVYWNSRLEYEHKRLVNMFKPTDVICDMFAGIGPFAVPAAQKGCTVYANDLNPRSVHYLRVNAKLNKVTSRIHCYNMDARAFVRQHLALPHAAEPLSRLEEGPTGLVEGASVHPATVPSNSTNGEGKEGIGSDGNGACPQVRYFDHVVMNLPASAIEFLDVFNGLLSQRQWEGPLPMIHCYCFQRAAETEGDVLKRAERALGGHIEDQKVWTVRDVAPNKVMLCLSFPLPKQVAYAARKGLGGQADEVTEVGTIVDHDVIPCGASKRPRVN